MSLPDSPLSRRARLRRAAIPEPGSIRTLTKVTLTNTFGNGLFTTIEAIFFTRSVGLTNHQVALGLGVAAVLGLLVSVPAGHLADRRGPRELIVIFLVLQGVGMAAFALVHSFGGFVAVAIASSILRSAGGSANMALVSRFGAGEERVRIRAFQRSVSNLGMSLGMGIAAVALAVDTREAYVAMVLGNAATYIGSAFFVMQFPAMPPTSPKGSTQSGPRLVALRDRHFLSATALAGCMSIQFAIQNIGVPLWIVQFTHAPRWWVAVVMLVNTTSVILLQVRFTRGTDDLEFAARAFRRSGIFIAAACLLYASAQGVGTTLACIILVVATMVDVVGELLGSAAGWAIGYGMAVEGLQGQYQGVYSLSFGIANIFGPILVTSTALALGRPGWVILGAMFIATGAAYPPLVRSHLKERARAATVDGDLS
jgi:MFS family permease